MQMRFLPITHKMITTKKSAFYLVLKKHILIQKLQNYDNHCKILPSAEVSRDWRYDLELHAWARIDILDACSFVRPFVCRSFRWWVRQTGVYQIWGKMNTIKCCGSHRNALIHSLINLFVHSFIHSLDALLIQLVSVSLLARAQSPNSPHQSQSTPVEGTVVSHFSLPFKTHIDSLVKW